MNKYTKTVIESLSDNTLLKKVQLINESIDSGKRVSGGTGRAANEDLKSEREAKLKKEFRAKVQSDIEYVVSKYDKAYQTEGNIHPQRALLAEDSGEVLLTFQRGMNYKFDTLKALEELTKGFEAEMGLYKVGEPWKSKAGKAAKSGEHRDVFNQILIKPEKREYRNLPGSLGLDFTIEVYSAMTSLTVTIKFSGKAL